MKKKKLLNLVMVLGTILVPFTLKAQTNNHDAPGSGMIFQKGDIFAVVASTDHYGETDHFPMPGNADELVDIDLDTVQTIEKMDPKISLHTIFASGSILFDYRSWELTLSSMATLDKVAEVMLQHPDVVFEVAAHTDARGLYKDNMVLSDRRAGSVVDYLVSKGVKLSQLVAVSYGERFLKNVCDSDSYCSDQSHASNRRVEIRVITLSK